MTPIRTLAAAVAAATVAACAGVQVGVGQADQSALSARVLRTRIDFVGPDYRTIPDAIVEQKSDERPQFRHVTFPDPIEVNFHSVTGRLAGPQQLRIHRIRLKRAFAALEPGTQKDFALSLAALGEMAASPAAAYRPQPEDEGFSVVPADARFARLIVSAGSPSLYPYDEHEAGLVDRSTGERYALLYVDRSCRITGSIRARDGVFEHDLDLRQAGLQWLRIQPTGEGRARVTAVEPSGPLSVYVRYAAP